jgi:hypothetical protein
MWMAVVAIFKWATGGPLNRILSSVDKSIDNETERQRITASVVERAVIADAENRAASMQSRVFWYVWALFSVPVGVWLGAICLDSVFLFSGQIADLPPSVKPYATQIIASIFGSGAGVAGVQAIAAAIRGRR